MQVPSTQASKRKQIIVNFVYLVMMRDRVILLTDHLTSLGLFSTILLAILALRCL
jgi:hypothetical protein